MTQAIESDQEKLVRLYRSRTGRLPIISSWQQLIEDVCRVYNLNPHNYLPPNEENVRKLISDIEPPIENSRHTSLGRQGNQESVSLPSLVLVVLGAIALSVIFFVPSAKNQILTQFESWLNNADQPVQITITDSTQVPVITDLNTQVYPTPTTPSGGGNPQSGVDNQAGGSNQDVFIPTSIPATPVWQSTMWPTTIPTPIPSLPPPEQIAAMPTETQPTPAPTPDTSQHAPYGYVDECWVRFGPINQCLDNRVLTELNVPTPEPEPQLTCGNASANQVVGEADSPMQEFFGYVQPHHLVYKDNPNTSELDPDLNTAVAVNTSCALNRSAIEFCMLGQDGRAYVLLMNVIDIYPSNPAYRWMARIELQPELNDPASCQ